MDASSRAEAHFYNGPASQSPFVNSSVQTWYRGHVTPLKPPVSCVCVCVSALNISGWADGAQMDSKVGMSLKIHDTHRDQGEWRGGGIKH